MSDQAKPTVGSVVWRDLTVSNAEAVRDSYSGVVGWTSEAHPMGEYDEFCMNQPGDGTTVAGICHARGTNARLPPQWLIYIAVENVGHSAARCRELGGEVIDRPRPMGELQFCVIRDSAGAVAALIGG